MNHQKWEIKHTDFSLVCAKPCKKSWLSCWPNADVVKIPRKIQQHRPWYKGGRSKGYLMHAIGTELNSLFLTILLYFYFLFFLFQIYFSASGQTYCLSTLCMQSGEKRKIELFANNHWRQTRNDISIFTTRTATLIAPEVWHIFQPHACLPAWSWGRAKIRSRKIVGQI